VPRFGQDRDVADEADALYALPLDDFTAARNELAKRSGDPEIKKLKKPSVSAWAVNQLARQREVDVRRLLRAGETLEQAQREALGGGDHRAFEKARRDERDAVRRLRSQAAELLRAGGHPASDATLERVARTLDAAAATPEGRELLRAGRLSEDLEPQGFDALAALAASVTPKARGRSKAAAPGPTAADRRRAKQAKAEADEARKDADAAGERLREAERALRNAEREVEKARTAADRAADQAERLAVRARELAV
jgi:hypothetical protein